MEERGRGIGKNTSKHLQLNMYQKLNLNLKAPFKEINLTQFIKQLQYLKVFRKWVLVENRERTMQNERRDKQVKYDANNIAQYILQCTRTERQVKNNKISETSGFQRHFQTPVSVGLSLMLYKQFRSRKIIDTLHEFNLIESYDQTRRIVTRISDEVLRQIKNSPGGYYLPPFLVKSQPVFFAADN